MENLIDNQEEKTCKNCRYFSEHYVKRKYIFTSTGLGYCCCAKGRKSKSRRYTDCEGICDLWELSTAQTQPSVREILQSIHERIVYLESLLKD